ncbi:protein-(glutamine-N5) methyltransferase, release factor-specific [Erythrobacter sp. KY5]|uniref:peptide chain release factor N(5)-glutamine methyltransferase n=1 Tax=Erythrobacter sp. KY5 TaxID=2011159 RepID=UPI000DBF0E0D|nr:peptide chain release factor N(5)-glutamine methyltransferase [Erythrobacter sp. KY5]AWW72999.1 protein-(glutamine-N5) methyltransferase, release factor-specific [Erythrobacter sp. KY5]
MTVSQALREAAQRLASTSDTARLDAELLMAHALGVNRSDMLLRHMADPRPEDFAALVERRAAREPVAHITGTQEFYGRDFAVSAQVLIPRGDSETLIDAALETAPHAGRVLDLGTGSGALLITVLMELEDATGIGIDASDAALKVARDNAQALGLIGAQARFLLRDWREDGWDDSLGTFDLILCNPPYVEEDAPLDPDVRDYEPASALFAGPEGLDDYRVIIPQLRKLLSPKGVALLEIGAAQGDAVNEMAQGHGFAVQMRHDLANRPRCVVLW